MASTVIVFDPTPPLVKQEPKLAMPALAALKGATVGFIDNAKPNFDYLADEIGNLLMTRYGVTKVIKRRKRVAGIPAPDAIMLEMSEQCALVITGSGD